MQNHSWTNCPNTGFHGKSSISMSHWTKNLTNIPTPCYLIDASQLKNNMAVIETIKASTNCHILLALKGFATYHTFSSLHSTLNGVTASSLYEARLGLEEFKKDIHVHCVAMNPMEAKQLNTLGTHISFNSKSQLQLFLKNVAQVKPSLGLK